MFVWFFCMFSTYSVKGNLCHPLFNKIGVAITSHDKLNLNRLNLAAGCLCHYKIRYAGNIHCMIV